MRKCPNRCGPKICKNRCPKCNKPLFHVTDQRMNSFPIRCKGKINFITPEDHIKVDISQNTCDETNITIEAPLANVVADVAVQQTEHATQITQLNETIINQTVQINEVAAQVEQKVQVGSPLVSVYGQNSDDPIPLLHDSNLIFSTAHPDFLNITVEPGSTVLNIDAPGSETMNDQITALQGAVSDIQSTMLTGPTGATGTGLDFTAADMGNPTMTRPGFVNSLVISPDPVNDQLDMTTYTTWLDSNPNLPPFDSQSMSVWLGDGLTLDMVVGAQSPVVAVNLDKAYLADYINEVIQGNS